MNLLCLNYTYYHDISQVFYCQGVFCARPESGAHQGRGSSAVVQALLRGRSHLLEALLWSSTPLTNSGVLEGHYYQFIAQCAHAQFVHSKKERRSGPRRETRATLSPKWKPGGTGRRFVDVIASGLLRWTIAQMCGPTSARGVTHRRLSSGSRRLLFERQSGECAKPAHDQARPGQLWPH